MRIAVISDIHGNVWALKRILDHISENGASLILNLGDSLYGPLDPRGTWELIQKNRIISIAGNEDRIIIDPETNIDQNDTLKYVISQLTDETVEWLRSLPGDASPLENVFMCHGTPDSDSRYLLENIKNGYPVKRSREDLAGIVKNVSENIILCGHSHLPGIAAAGGKIIINPGSVGLQAYDDDNPVFHQMQTGSNEARYSMVDINGDDVIVDRISLGYQFEEAASAAEKNNRYDWAGWLRTGYA